MAAWGDLGGVGESARIQLKYTAQKFLIKKYKRSKDDVLTNFYVDLEQARVVWKEGTSVMKI